MFGVWAMDNPNSSTQSFRKDFQLKNVYFVCFGKQNKTINNALELTITSSFK
jgi:hypothetical protein